MAVVQAHMHTHLRRVEAFCMALRFQLIQLNRSLFIPEKNGAEMVEGNEKTEMDR